LDYQTILLNQLSVWFASHAEQFDDLSPAGLDVTGLYFAQERFEFGEHLARSD